jgi:hypothetical protein
MWRLVGILVVAGSFIRADAVAQVSTAPGDSAPSAAERMAEPGPAELGLRRDVGMWDVVTTMWPSAGGTPIVTRGLVAERTMVGPILQEIMRPAPGAHVPDFRRIDYINFDRVEGRWKYVSMDTRFPVSIMPAWSFGPTPRDTVTVQFAPQAFVGFGKEVEGRFLVADIVFTRTDADHEAKRMHFHMATGDGAPWLFVEYIYTRRR